MRRRYFILDVFTGAPFTGNPLAVVRDCDDLDAAQMQAVAAELSLSETCFVAATADAATFDLRWFTPEVEMDLAGHPTLATAFVIFSELGHDSDTIHFHTSPAREYLSS